MDKIRYSEIMDSMVEFFYLQRCGEKLPKERAGIFAHEACHSSKARIYGTQDYIDVQGGWHDAGDYGRYVGPGALTVLQLLFSLGKGNKTNGLLDEIRYELDWMMRMQRNDGALYHKVSCANFCDFIMPEQEQEELIVSPVSVTATADFAAAAALASHWFAEEDLVYAKQLETAAKRAYSAMKQMKLPGGFVNPEGIVTGEYGDTEDKDERYMAAAVMYAVFGDEQYHNDFKKVAFTEVLHGYGWEDMASFGNYIYIHLDEQTRDQKLYEKIKNSMLAFADKLLEISQEQPYNVAVNDFIWGSNFYVAQCGAHLMDAYDLTGDEKYLKAAKQQMDYLLGHNPLGMCYLTGFGERSPQHPHHRPSEAVGQPMPGMLVGGPDQYLHDEEAIKHLQGKEPAKCYIDVLGSYSTNEVTIYWNGAAIFLLTDLWENSCF